MNRKLLTLMAFLMLVPACLFKAGIEPADSDSGGDVGVLTVTSTKATSGRATFNYTLTDSESSGTAPWCAMCYSTSEISDS